MTNFVHNFQKVKLTMKANRKKEMWSSIAISTTFFFILLISSCQKSAPAVKTISAIAKNGTTIIVSGQIIDNGGENVYSFGFCVSKNTSPTRSDTQYDCITPTSDHTAVFTTEFTNLQINTNYYVRAYAINKEGISYGEELKVKTSALSMITTLEANNITKTEATLNALVNPLNSDTENWFEYWDDGGIHKTTISTKINGASQTTINSTITGLTPDKTYSFIAKSKNETGETSGETFTFTTYAVSDFDGNFYHTITIGNQVWTKENFRGSHYLNGDAIPFIQDSTQWANQTSGAYCYYNNDPEIGKDYGGLYNWYTTIDPRGLIAGYHVPSYDEWDALRNYLGGQNVAGTKLKESGTAHWKSPNNNATNSTGFTALPGGLRTEYRFTTLNEAAMFWTNTIHPVSPFIAREYSVSIGSPNLSSNGNPCNAGQSIRLVKN